MTALAQIEMPILGVFRREKDIELPSRHLGLVPANEVSTFTEIAKRLATIGERCFDWEKLEPILEREGKGRRLKEQKRRSAQAVKFIHQSE